MNFLGIIAILFYLLSITMLGLAFLSICNLKFKNLLQSLASGYVFGSGLSGLIFFYLAMSGIRASLLWIMIIFICAILLFIMSKKINFPSVDTFNNSKESLRISQNMVLPFAIFALLFSFILLIGNIFFTPLWDVDSFALWGLKSKAIFYTLLDKEEYFYRVSYGFSHLEYPLMVPFLNSGVMICIGGAHMQNLIKILYLPLLISFAVLIYFAAAEKTIPEIALGLAAIFISTPALIQWSSAGTADIYVLVFHFSAIYFSLNWLRNQRSGYLISAIFANVFLVFTKNEGLPLGLFNIIVLFIFSLRLRISQKDIFKICIAVLSAFLSILPWFMWSADIPRIHENYPAQIANILKIEHIARIPQIAKIYLLAFFDIYRWGLIWFLCAAAIFRANLNREFLFPATLLFLNLSLYFFIFIISPWELEYLRQAALERLILHLCAPGIFLIIEFFSISFPKKLIEHLP